MTQAMGVGGPMMGVPKGIQGGMQGGLPGERAGVVEPVSTGALGGLGLLVLVALAWGANWPVSKFVLSEVPPLSARGWAGIGGAALAFGLAWSRREHLWPAREQWAPLVASALLNFSAWVGLAVLSLLWLSASEAAIIAYTLPAWAMALGWPLLRVRPDRAQLAGLGFGVAGLAVLEGGQGAAAAWARLPGVACVIGAGLCVTLGAALQRRHPLRLPPMTGAAWQIGIGTLPLLAAALVFERPQPAAVGPLGWAGIAYTGAVPLGLAGAGWFAALRRLPARIAAAATLLAPVAGVAGAALLLGEPIGPRPLLALLLTVVGAGLAILR